MAEEPLVVAATSGGSSERETRCSHNVTAAIGGTPTRGRGGRSWRRRVPSLPRLRTIGLRWAGKGARPRRRDGRSPSRRPGGPAPKRWRRERRRRRSRRGLTREIDGLRPRLVASRSQSRVARSRSFWRNTHRLGPASRSGARRLVDSTSRLVIATRHLALRRRCRSIRSSPSPARSAARLAAARLRPAAASLRSVRSAAAVPFRTARTTFPRRPSAAVPNRSRSSLLTLSTASSRAARPW